MQDLEEHADNQSKHFTFASGLGFKKLEGLIASVLIFVQISTPIPIAGWESLSATPANAVLYSPDTKVPRTGELALRRAIPANTNMKAIQARLILAFQDFPHVLSHMNTDEFIGLWLFPYRPHWKISPIC